MYGKYFTYDNEASTDYDLMIGGFQIDDVPLAMNRELLKGTLNRYRNRVNHMGTQWSDVLEFTISFIKDPCNKSHQSNMIFTEDEVDAINTWLTSPDYPILFRMYDYDFERDGSGTMVLIDNANGQRSFQVTITSTGYSTVTLGIVDGIVDIITPTIVYDNTDPQNPVAYPMPPIPNRIVFHDGYMSFLYDDKQYVKNIASIAIGNVGYEAKNVNDWMSVYGNGGSYENSYMLLVNKELVLNQKYNYFGLFSNIEAETFCGDIIGLTATFTTDSPFAWTDTITKTFNVSDGDTIMFNVKSSEKYREIYPVIKIQTPLVGGTRSNITIHNNVDGYELKLNFEDSVTIDCAHTKISNESGIKSFEDLGITDTDYIYWPRLYNGENSFTIAGDCTLIFEYREPRKVGAY